MTSPPGLKLTEHTLEVPLHPGSDERISVFAREVADPDGMDRPFLVFLQGGPGFEAPRPSTGPSPGWLGRALKDFRVLLVDQRGTGRSGEPPADVARLVHYRADAIVRDCEAFRRHLGVDRWSVLGQSFGGLCVLNYLSVAPESLKEAFFTGGLPPIGDRIEDAYRATFARVFERCERYYTRYPSDLPRVLALHERLEAEDVRLPSGDRLTSRRLRTLGELLGMSDGAESLHYILELDHRSRAFLHDVDANFTTVRNPIYGVLHEACWADGGTTRWAAQRLLPEAPPEFFYGEHVFPWMFEDVAALTPYKDAAHALAEHEWPRLYDPDVLAANEVPCAAAIYAEDMYVPREFSEETAAAVHGLRPWLTNELEHNGLRMAGDRVLGRLLDLARGRA